MDQPPKVTNIKNEPNDSTSSVQLEISSEMQVHSYKQEESYLIHTEFDIKTKIQEDEHEFPVITSYASTSYDLCPNDDIKFKTDKSLIKIEYEGLVDELMQDPLGIDTNIKIEEEFSRYLDQAEASTKTEPIDRENEENLLESDEDDSYSSESNQDQELLIKNDLGHKDKKYACHQCNKTFKQKCNLDEHLRIHTGEKPYKCGVCEKSFNIKGNLDRHMLLHSGEKPHSCDVCTKIFRDKSTLRQHKLIHGKVKQFSCKECNKSFIQKPQLVAHKLLHTGNKPFACDLCDKAFTRKLILINHMRTHSGEKPYSCDICKKSFTQKTNLDRHKKNHKN